MCTAVCLTICLCCLLSWTQHTAAESGWRGKNSIELLLKYGLDVDARIKSSGATALMMAARSGAEDSVKLLLKAGAEVNAKAGESLYGMTALCKTSN